MTESRVDNITQPFKNNLQLTSGSLAVWRTVACAWQFTPVDNATGRYIIRLDTSGVDQQMSACYRPTEIAPGQTGICMGVAENNDAHKWDVSDWGDGSFRIQNIANGTGYNLDVHPGNPPFLSNQIQTDVVQPAQHWLISSQRPVNDGAWSTLYTDQVALTQVSTTQGSTTQLTKATFSASANLPGSTSNTSSGGLSAGAAAGISIAATLAVFLFALTGFIFWRRRQRQRKQQQGPIDMSSYVGFSPGGAWYREDAKSPFASMHQAQYKPVEAAADRAVADPHA